jgi:hypothetical protein
MLMAATQPSLDQIYGFISNVRKYPVSVIQLLKLARDVKAPRGVIEFYDRFSKDQVFGNQEELMSRSEQVGIMREEEAEMPSDGLFVPGED